MQITSVKMKRINSSKPNNKLLAIASIQLDNELLIHDLKLIELENKRMVSFPNKRTEYRKLNEAKDGYDVNMGYTDVVHPCTPQLRKYIEETLFDMYDKELKGEDNE